jgi:hypothetical protein
MELQAVCVGAKCFSYLVTACPKTVLFWRSQNDTYESKKLEMLKLNASSPHEQQ